MLQLLDSCGKKCLFIKEEVNLRSRSSLRSLLLLLRSTMWLQWDMKPWQPVKEHMTNKLNIEIYIYKKKSWVCLGEAFHEKLRLVWQWALTTKVCVVLQAVCCADAAYCCLKGRFPIVVILSHCSFVDVTAGIGIRLSVVVSIVAVGHPSAIPGLCPGLSHDATWASHSKLCSWGSDLVYCVCRHKLSLSYKAE